MYCSACGQAVPDNSFFCPFCGTDISEKFEIKTSLQKESQTIQPQKSNVPIIILSIIIIILAAVLVILFIVPKLSNSNKEPSTEETLSSTTEASTENISEDETTTNPTEENGLIVAKDSPYSTGYYRVSSSSGLILRQSQSKNSVPIFTIPHTERIYISEVYYSPNQPETTEYWGKTEYKGYTGWVAMYYTEPDFNSSSPNKPQSPSYTGDTSALDDIWSKLKGYWNATTANGSYTYECFYFDGDKPNRIVSEFYWASEGGPEGKIYNVTVLDNIYTVYVEVEDYWSYDEYIPGYNYSFQLDLAKRGDNMIRLKLPNSEWKNYVFLSLTFEGAYDIAKKEILPN